MAEAQARLDARRWHGNSLSAALSASKYAATVEPLLGNGALHVEGRRLAFRQPNYSEAEQHES